MVKGYGVVVVVSDGAVANRILVSAPIAFGLGWG